MNTGTLVLIVFIVLMAGAFPSWPHSQNWGYVPSGSMGMVVIIVALLMVTGRL